MKLNTILLSVVFSFLISCTNSTSTNYSNKWRGGYLINVSSDVKIADNDTSALKDLNDEYVIALSPLSKGKMEIRNLLNKERIWNANVENIEGVLYFDSEFQEDDYEFMIRKVNGHFAETQNGITFKFTEKWTSEFSAPIYENYQKTITTMKSTEDSDFKFESKRIDESYDNKEMVDLKINTVTFTHKGTALRVIK